MLFFRTNITSKIIEIIFEGKSKMLCAENHGGNSESHCTSVNRLDKRIEKIKMV